MRALLSTFLCLSGTADKNEIQIDYENRPFNFLLSIAPPSLLSLPSFCCVALVICLATSLSLSLSLRFRAFFICVCDGTTDESQTSE